MFYSFFDSAEPQISLKAIFDNGSIIEYFACHQTRIKLYDEQPDKFEYLGYGRIYEINGVKQKLYPDIKYHFWRKLS